MGIKTRSVFYYGHEVDKNEHFISINEGSGELIVNLVPSGYSFTELAAELARALNEAGSNSYAVTVNRDNRRFTISSSGNFSILAASGSYMNSSLYTTLGFNFADKSGLSSYTSDFSTGKVWEPQLTLFNYVPSAHKEGSLQATQDESGSGEIQVVNFGTINMMEFEARYITNRSDKPSIIDLDLAGVENAMAFLKYIRQKNRIEFMEDKNNRSIYEKFILTKSSSSSTGLEVQLFEMTGQNLQDYYETRLLSFRKVT